MSEYIFLQEEHEKYSKLERHHFKMDDESEMTIEFLNDKFHQVLIEGSFIGKSPLTRKLWSTVRAIEEKITELEEKHGMTDFKKRFNPLRFYSPEELIEFYKRDIQERSEFLEMLFGKQERAADLQEVINVWKKFKIPSPDEIREFYETHFGKVD